MTMTFELLVLRLVHILGGIFWVGSVLFTTVILVPALAASGANVGLVMSAVQNRRYLTFLPAVAVTTILSGLRLLWINSAGFSPGYFHSPQGLAFSLAGTAATIAFLSAMLIVRPSAARSAALGHAVGNAPDDQRPRLARELAALRRRHAMASAVTLTLLVMGAGGMAVARYLP